MELRYTTKVYLFNKAIQKLELTKPQFHILYTVSINDGKRLIDIQNTLAHVNREPGYNYTIKYLKQLINKGYIVRKGFRYTITCAGINILKHVELNLRKRKVVKIRNSTFFISSTQK